MLCFFLVVTYLESLRIFQLFDMQPERMSMCSRYNMLHVKNTLILFLTTSVTGTVFY
jgi:hypothetical protein